MDYYTVYRAMKRLGIAPTSDGACRGLLLDEVDADRIVEELARIRRLQDRALTVQRAAAALGVTRGVVQKWADAGRLTYDPELDGNGFRYVTRASVEATQVIRFGRRPRVSVAAFKNLTGFDDAAVAALVKAGLLVRMPRGALSPMSVRTWAIAYRPDLLDDPLLGGARA